MEVTANVRSPRWQRRAWRSLRDVSRASPAAAGGGKTRRQLRIPTDAPRRPRCESSHMPRSHLKLLAAAGLAGGVLVLAGCGGSSGPSKAQFVAKADAICKTTQAQITPLVNEIAAAGAKLLTGAASATRQVATVVQHLHSVAAGSLAKLRALAQPNAD